MTLEDLDFPDYKTFKKTSPFNLLISKKNAEIINELAKPLIRVQFKLSSKRKQIIIKSECEPESLVTPRVMQKS